MFCVILFENNAAGEARKEGTVSAVLRPQTPTSAAADDAREAEPLPDIEKYAFSSFLLYIFVTIGPGTGEDAARAACIRHLIAHVQVQECCQERGSASGS